MKKALLVIGTVLLADQTLKVWVKSTMILGQEHVLADWCILHFTENMGMAFGMEFGGETGKLMLSLFRILAAVGIGYYLFNTVKKGASTLVTVALSLVFAGAVGNIIDSTFYGLLFSESYGQVAEVLPKDGGYAGLFFGRVVDMFYFPIIDTHLPDWLPERPYPKPSWMPHWLYSTFPYANDHFLFFRPVFNVADSAITVGMALIILFQKQFLGKE